MWASRTDQKVVTALIPRAVVRESQGIKVGLNVD